MTAIRAIPMTSEIFFLELIQAPPYGFAFPGYFREKRRSVSADYQTLKTTTPGVYHLIIAL